MSLKKRMARIQEVLEHKTVDISLNEDLEDLFFELAQFPNDKQEILKELLEKSGKGPFLVKEKMFYIGNSISEFFLNEISQEDIQEFKNKHKISLDPQPPKD